MSGSPGIRSELARRPLLGWTLLALAIVLSASTAFRVASASAAEPVVTIEPPTTTYTSAHVTGNVDPGSEALTVYFEYKLPSSAGWTEVRGDELAPGQGPTPVSTTFTQLTSGTEYLVRIDAYRPEGNGKESHEFLSSELTFTTETALAPVVTVRPPRATTSTSAELVGLVNPSAPQPEGSTSSEEQAIFGTNWHFECTPECPGLSGFVAADDTSHEVEATATGLLPGKIYEVSIIASSAGGEVIDGPLIFSTPAAPPSITSIAAVEVSGASATLQAEVDPGGAVTNYHFEYLTDAQFVSGGGYANPLTISTEVGKLPASNDTSLVEVGISGLLPGTIYHFRAVAGNESPGDPVTRSQDRTFVAAIGQSHAESGGCPNEALRSENLSLGLPDCGAYERVTPVYQNGGHLVQPLVLGESRLTAVEFGSFAGTQNTAPLGSQYEFFRSVDGWSASSLRPPATEFQAQGGGFTSTPFVGSDGTTVQALRSAAQPADAEELFVGRGANLTRIGAVDYPGAWREPAGIETPAIQDEALFGFTFLDATQDISHVLYKMASPQPGGHGYLWPFDATQEGGYNSLYEYTGTDNSEPTLVGVTGGRGSHDLISACGTSLGSFNQGDVYNAMSADGSIVYFTSTGEDRVGSCPGPVGAPPVTELSARLDGEAASAHTASISEPSHTDCPECQTAASEVELREAVFQGASEDGSRVFFLTEQELLPGNPGKNLYEYDFDAPVGQKVTAVSHLAGGSSGVLGVVRVSEDGSHVYFVASSVLTSNSNSPGVAAVSGQPNLYVYDTETGRTSFVATLEPLDEPLWAEVDFERPAEATPDGHFLVFASHAQLTPDDTSSASQLFRYDADSGGLVRVSVGRQGFSDNGNSSTDPVTVAPRFSEFYSAIKGPPQKLISDDGSRIFFESTNGLTPAALNHQPLPNSEGFAENVYEWHNGEVSLISDGRDRAESYIFISTGVYASAVQLLGTSADGSSVFFTTADQLVPNDQDSIMDIYDVRLGGGFPNLPPITSCSAESCQGVSPPSAGPQSAASSTYVGPVDANVRHRHQRRKHHRKKHRRHGPPKRSRSQRDRHHRSTGGAR